MQTNKWERSVPHKGYKKNLKGVENIAPAVAKQPVAVAFYVQSDFMSYHQGIYSPTLCPFQPNHGVTVVEYKRDTLIPYFKIKNSWGMNWGEKGFFRMSIGSGNGTCNIGGHNGNYYPTL